MLQCLAAECDLRVWLMACDDLRVADGVKFYNLTGGKAIAHGSLLLAISTTQTLATQEAGWRRERQ